MGDPDRLTVVLAEYLTEFGQRRWHAITKYWKRPRLHFIHAKKNVPGGVDELMVTAALDPDRGRIRLHRYLLLEGRKDWLYCDQEAFEGFLEEGPRGLKRGHIRQAPTSCRCKWKAYPSSGRAAKYAREWTRRYGAAGVQRPYRCPENPRIYHLTVQQKGSGAPISGARIEPDGDL